MSQTAEEPDERGQVSVAAASPADAEDVYGILRDAFGDSYLRFSVFQSGRAVAYLREEILNQADGSLRAFVVARRGERTLGFYSAVRRGYERFLSYIATTSREHSTGVGRLLLGHFESAALSSGCRTVGLDVFAGNEKACQWYIRHGYASVSRRYHYRFASETLRDSGEGVLHVHQADLVAAQRDEDRRGFAAVPATYRGARVRLGLIGDEVFNVMEPVGDLALEVAGAVVRGTAKPRKWVLTVSPVPLREADRAESEAQAIYMTKELCRGLGGEKAG